ncbi:MlaD family protein [Amycolatopsis sp. CA-230715]|uniref:MlaD family protein n=1 Tax=Amycolatopsis sp. CA-230715 TaxID=2745196 RepID=UPI001C01C265|nr:MlaD family protein [Amycolatopsis sp. CA-230715]QWF82662.1 Lipoprotein LprN [Amycolatopsis sp. CA-230715]
MKRLWTVAVAAFALTGCGVSFQNLPIGRAPAGDSYRVTMVFDNAANLPMGGKVKLGQAVVGRISELRAENFHAVVSVAVYAGVRLPTGTKAQVQVTSALGEEFIALQPPAQVTGYLGEGAVLGLADTSKGPTVEDLLAAAGTMLSGAGIDQIRTIVSETNSMLGGREGEVRGLFAKLDTLLGSVEAHRSDLTRAIDALSTLTSTANNERATIAAGLTRITPAIKVLLDQRGTLENLMGRVTTLSKATTAVLGKTQDQVVALAKQARPLLDEIGGLDSALGTALGKIGPLKANFDKAVPGDYLDLDATLDVPNTLLPLLTGSPPPAPGSAPPNPGGLADLLGRGVR